MLNYHFPFQTKRSKCCISWVLKSICSWFQILPFKFELLVFWNVKSEDFRSKGHLCFDPGQETIEKITNNKKEYKHLKNKATNFSPNLTKNKNLQNEHKKVNCVWYATQKASRPNQGSQSWTSNNKSFLVVSLHCRLCLFWSGQRWNLQQICKTVLDDGSVTTLLTS